jgi:hypothetical protein
MAFDKGYAILRFVGYFVGYTVLWGIFALASQFFPATKTTTDLIPTWVIHFLRWPFCMACISGIAIPLLKSIYGVIAEDISNRAAIKVRYMDRDPAYRDRVWRETDGMNWELGLQDKLFPGSHEQS